MSSRVTGSRNPIKPDIEVKDDRDQTRVTRHPAFGTMSFYAVNGEHKGDLFGANVRVSNSIRMRVSRAHMTSVTVDRYDEDDLILEVEMTEAQFTQAITHLNRGSGTPVTIVQAPDEGTPALNYPQISPVDIEEKFKGNGDRRLENELERIMTAFKAVKDVALADGGVSKKALKEAVHTLEAVIGNVPRNFEYYREVMHEDVDKFIREAKRELHASANLLTSDPRRQILMLDDVNNEVEDHE